MYSYGLYDVAFVHAVEWFIAMNSDMILEVIGLPTRAVRSLATFLKIAHRYETCII